ncbi:hypothetical protein Vadar_016413 [Vaccinium darrowii]|uniref:Uncharacterized protein n=1 Tax=Vaccinium darrowii TaxID=229202 RepID=A0ACB7YF92_9ERIC|nr:hypothetical protein Vadar_016413 [Vaccinium darrowii]
MFLFNFGVPDHFAGRLNVNQRADSDRTLPEMSTVAVAIKGGGGSFGELGSRRAVQWAVETLMPDASRLVLIHVVPPITSVPTPCGDTIPIDQLDDSVVEMYMQDTKDALQEIFLPFKKLCKRTRIETLVLEDVNPASALHKYVIESGVSSLVLGSSSFIMRKPKDSTVPSAFQKYEACTVYVVSRHRLLPLLTTCATPLSMGVKSCGQWPFKWRERSSHGIHNFNSGHYSSSVNCEVNNTTLPVSDPSQERNHQNSGNSIILEIESDGQAEVELQRQESNGDHYSSVADSEVNDEASSVHSHCNAIVIAEQRYPNHSCSLPERNHSEIIYPSVASTETNKSDLQAEVEQLRLELMISVGMYNRACEDLLHTQNEVHFLSNACLEEERQVIAALQREADYKKNAAEEKRKHLEAVKEIEMAKNLLAKEAFGRQIAELEVLKESFEKIEIVYELFSKDRRYRKYTRDEIEIATDFFSESKLIGEGSYGKVYRCNLNKTPVAVKVLHSDAFEKIKEFLTEIEVLSQIRHPHIVSLLGACPEIGCLVYEYMENGSLQDFVSDQSSRHPLPWFVRFRIAFEVACGLAFLHNSKPDPIIHRDLKPGNIFLDRNYVSKIGDVGLAKHVSDVMPDNITVYRDSGIFGTLYYVDPEYHRTGTVRPKSDLYAFGIVVLQLLATRHPEGLLLKFQAALSNGWLPDILDKSILDWPLAEVKELAQMALRCSSLQCRDRPDLETEVLPLLKKLADKAAASSRVQRNNIHAPNHYFCPILQEVMEDPYIAADGFSYEHRAIKAWLERDSSSPVLSVSRDSPQGKLPLAMKVGRFSGLLS